MTFTVEQREFIATLPDCDFTLLAQLAKEPKVITFLAYADANRLSYFTHFGFAKTSLGKYNQLVWQITTFGEEALKFQ